jgi:hypothetical protein
LLQRGAACVCLRDMHGFAERGGEPPPPHEDERIFAEERWFSVDRQADAYVELLKATSRAQYCSLIRRSRKIDFALIHPSAWNKNSRKFTCRILDKIT